VGLSFYIGLLWAEKKEIEYSKIYTKGVEMDGGNLGTLSQRKLRYAHHDCRWGHVRSSYGKGERWRAGARYVCQTFGAPRGGMSCQRLKGREAASPAVSCLARGVSDLNPRSTGKGPAGKPEGPRDITSSCGKPCLPSVKAGGPVSLSGPGC